MSGSNILYFDVNVVFYIVMCYSYLPVHGLESLYPASIRPYIRSALDLGFLCDFFFCGIKIWDKIRLACLQLTRYIIYEICIVDINYTDTKMSGSNILYFDVNVAFYIVMCYSYLPVHGLESLYDIQNNNLRKRLENTPNFAFDFVAFLVSINIHILILTKYFGWESGGTYLYRTFLVFYMFDFKNKMLETKFRSSSILTEKKWVAV